jgi:hypothetical protein
VTKDQGVIDLVAAAAAEVVDHAVGAGHHPEGVHHHTDCVLLVEVRLVDRQGEEGTLLVPDAAAAAAAVVKVDSFHTAIALVDAVVAVLAAYAGTEHHPMVA